jgi:hypothetical protein
VGEASNEEHTWIRVRPAGHNLEAARPRVPSRRPSGCRAPVSARLSRGVGPDGHDGQRPAMLLPTRAAANGAIRRHGRPPLSNRRGRVQRQRRAVATRGRRRRLMLLLLRHIRRVARHGGPRRRLHGGQLALAVPGRREAVVLARRRAVAALGQGYVLEGDCAFYVFASKYGCILPLYKHADVRGGHGTERWRRRLRDKRQLIGYAGQAT